jgi:RimJ/RimL family protein N-acetyltransferase
VEPERTPAIVTEHLRLEPFTTADSESILSGRREPSWAPGYPTAGDREVARWVSTPRFVPQDPRFGPRKVVVRQGGLVIGGIGFHGAPRDGEVEIGFGIAEEWRRRGLGAEAVTAFVHYAFTLPGVRRVQAETDPGNEASVRTLGRAGLLRVPGGGRRLAFAASRGTGPSTGLSGGGGTAEPGGAWPTSP